MKSTSLVAAILRSPRIFSFALLLILPFGYYPDYPDSSQFEIGVGGGFGQVASITRSCSGDLVEKEANSFQDVAVSGFARVKLSDRSELVYGTQLGYFHATSHFADLYQPYPDSYVDRWYFSPRIALEMKHFGAGLGLVANQIPYNFDNGSDWDKHLTGPSFHLRIGSLRGFYFLTSLGENSPMVAGGGHFDAGFGFPIGGKVRMYSAVSVGPYDHAGYLQQVDLGLNRKMALQLAMRAGEAEGIFEGALSASLVFRLGALKE